MHKRARNLTSTAPWCAATLVAMAVLPVQGCTIMVDRLAIAPGMVATATQPDSNCLPSFHVTVDVPPLLRHEAESIHERTSASTRSVLVARGCTVVEVDSVDHAALRVNVRRTQVPILGPHFLISLLTLGLIPTWDHVHVGEFRFEDVLSGRRETIGLDATRVAHLVFMVLELSSIDDENDHDAWYRKALERFLGGAVPLGASGASRGPSRP